MTEIKNKNKKTEKEDLQKKIFDIEVSLFFIQEDLSEISTRMMGLNKLQKDLTYNVNLHKTGNVATSLREYRRSIDDLNKIVFETDKLVKLQEKLNKDLNYYIKEHDACTIQYEKMLLEKDNKILKMDEYAKENKRRGGRSVKKKN